MKVLWVTNKGYPVKGGAQITNIAFSKKLSEKFGCRCHIYNYSPIKKRSSYGHVGLSTFRDAHELKVMIRGLMPDIIISTMDISHHVVKLAKLFNIPAVVYIHSFEYCPTDVEEKKKWKISLTSEYPKEEEINFVMKEADSLVVNSHYMQKRFGKKYGINPLVIYPEFIKEDLPIKEKSSHRGSYITGVCGYAYKGADIFLNLAKRFSENKFLLVGNSDFNYLNFFKEQENITILPFAPLKKFLKMSKVVLVPSQWPEPFGRIAVEAMANGIPTLASSTGGLKEIAGGLSSGVRQFRNAGAWEKKLQELLLSDKTRELNVREGKELLGKYLNDHSTHSLNRLIKRLVKDKKPSFDGKKTIAFCGAAGEKTAYSGVNSKWCDHFGREKDYAVINLENPNKFYNLPVDYFVYHDYRQNFNNLLLPDEGKFIAVRTWDFGRFPARWVEKINEECDRLWVHSSWARKQAVDSGIDPQRVEVIPHGIDENTFKPIGEKYRLSTEKRLNLSSSGQPF